MHQIKDKLSELPIEDLAWEYGFYKRQPRKITATGFVTAFFNGLCSTRHLSLNQWSMNLFFAGLDNGKCGQDVSPQALEKRLGFSRIPFMEALLHKAMEYSLARSLGQELFQQKKMFRPFGRVLVQDSVGFNLPANLNTFFTGSRRMDGSSNATVKVQAVADVFAQQYLSFDLGPYTRNDQSYSADILQLLQKDDLVIRDLGYFSTAILKKVEQKGAYYLSRLKFPITLYDEQGKILDLMKLLRKAKQKGWAYLDRQVLISAEHKFACRMVALKVPAAAVRQRQRKARHSRNNQNRYTGEHFERLEWTILITNVDRDNWKPRQVARAYAVRWRIEILFKIWKSGLGMHRQFLGIQSLSPPKVQIMVYLFLTWITLYFQGAYHYFFKALIEQYKLWLSTAKFAAVIKQYWHAMMQCELWEILVPVIARYAAYQKRKDRENAWERLASNDFKSSLCSYYLKLS